MKRNRTFLIIGLTGGAGSGKTTVVECIKQVVPTEFIHCDVIAHELMQPGRASYLALVKEYGTQILAEQRDAKETESAIDRERLAKVAFASEKTHQRLNELTHPLVLEEVERRLKHLSEEQFHGVAVIEAALLIESGYTRMCDEVWYVHAPLEDRKRRMREARGYSDEKIESIIERQLSEQEFISHSNFVIENPDGAELPKEKIAVRIKEQLETV